MDYYENFKYFHYYYKFVGLNHIVIDGEPFQHKIRVSLNSSILYFCGFIALLVINYYCITMYQFPGEGDPTTDFMIVVGEVVSFFLQIPFTPAVLNH